MSVREEVAYPLLRKHDVDYVLVIFGGLLGFSGDDINKFLWMVRISEGIWPEEVTEQKYFTSRGEYKVDKDASETMKNSLMYKMSYYRCVPSLSSVRSASTSGPSANRPSLSPPPLLRFLSLADSTSCTAAARPWTVCGSSRSRRRRSSSTRSVSRAAPRRLARRAACAASSSLVPSKC